MRLDRSRPLPPLNLLYSNSVPHPVPPPRPLHSGDPTLQYGYTAQRLLHSLQLPTVPAAREDERGEE